MARSAVRLLSDLLVITAVTGIVLAPVIIRVIAPGFAGSPEKFQLTVTLTRIMFPYIFFICLVALAMGILNVLGHFAGPALAPVFLNVAMIGSVLIISPRMDEPVMGLAIGVIIGGVLQLGLQVPFLPRSRYLKLRDLLFSNENRSLTLQSRAQKSTKSPTLESQATKNTTSKLTLRVTMLALTHSVVPCRAFCSKAKRIIASYSES